MHDLTPVGEHVRARIWRTTMELSRAQLSRLTGYSQQAIYQFERGVNAGGEEHTAEVWQRYKLACLGVTVMKAQGVSSVDSWNWAA